MFQGPSNHAQESDSTTTESSSRLNKVPRPGWPECIVGLVGLARCRPHCLQPAPTPVNGSCWHRLIGRIIWRFN
jgi:hypothetical protein